MLTEQQKRAAQAIVNIFETGRPQGEYGRVTLLRGDPGHLTYGKAQTTLASGNLYLLIKAYCETPNAHYGSELAHFLERLSMADIVLDHDRHLRTLLQEAGDDPVMQEVQDAFFERIYWNPAFLAAKAIGIVTALGVAVVYDSCIHGSWKRMRERTVSRHGRVDGIGERQWITHYVNVREEWLKNHSIPILRKTVYRMEAFRKLIEQGNWDLNLPFHVRGIRIDEDTLGDGPVRISARPQEERLLRLSTPHMKGDDVKELQQALAKAGFIISDDGIFGPETEKAVRSFQKRHGLRSDGIVGPATRSVLDI